MRKWNYLFEVPEQKKIRVIVHTDCKNEADDQFALAQHVMTPKFVVTGIIGAHFNTNYREYGPGNTAKASVEEIHKVLSLMDIDDMYDVYEGAGYPMVSETEPRDSAGARYIIEEAMKDDPRPLYIACLGGVTDLASAILLKPEICSRMTCIWIGGGNYPEGCWEFNMGQDVAAANVLMKSEMPLWQIPMNTYKQMTVSLAELQLYVRPCGAIGKYLFEQMVEFNDNAANVAHWPHGEIWGLGDNPTIAVLLEEQEKTDSYTVRPAPCIRYDDMKYSYEQENRAIRVYHKVDSRLTLSDLFAKLKLNFG